MWGNDTTSTSGPMLYTSSYGGQRFFTANIPRMNINAGGNVGIGTSSPLSRVHLSNGTTYGNILFEPGVLSDGSNFGCSVINFNGYYNAGERRIDTTKNRWRFFLDQRSGSDNFYIDTFNGTTLLTTLSITTAGAISIPGTLSTGILSKAGGSFRISHPDPVKKDTHDLVHCFVESPTRGDNLYRYTVNLTSGQSTIPLPTYWQHLNEDPQIWVSPTNHFAQSYATINTELSELTVYSSTQGSYNVLLIGTRKDQLMKDYFDNKGGVEQLKN